MKDLAAWLADSALAVSLRDTSWAVPAIQSVHIAAIALLLTASLVGQLRFAGWMAADQPAGAIAAWLRPRVRALLGVLLGTGLLMIVSEPNRTLSNAVFWLKLVIVVGALALSEWQVRTALAQRPPGLRTTAIALAVLLLWIAAIACGRWIAYLY